MNNLMNSLKLAKNKLIEKLLLIVLFGILANLVILPYPVLAEAEKADTGDNTALSYQLVSEDQVNSLIKIINPEVFFSVNNSQDDGHLPENKALTVKYAVKTVMTAYNSEVGQCDDTPCVTANGFNVCKHGKEDTIAMNGIKMGTKVRFPELFGDRVFVVRDRMNARYDSGRADVWMISKADAKKFGVKVARMEVLE